MSAPNTQTLTYDTIGSITDPLISQKVADNITQNIPVLYLLDKMGNKEYENGGTQYNIPVYKQQQNVQAYAGETVLSYQEADPVTSAYYNRKLLTIPVTLTGQKLLINGGDTKEAIIDYATTIVETAQEDMKSGMAGQTVGIFSNNNESDLGITGLQTLVSSTPTTGTAGNLARATYSWWQNYQLTCATGFGTNGLISLRTAFVNLVRGMEVPTVGIMTMATWVNFHRSLSSTIQYNLPTPNTQSGDLAFQHLYFQGVPFMFDYNCPANTCYMLNLKYMKFLVHAKRDMVFRDFIAPVDQDALVGRMYWAGNLVASNMARQGVITGVLDTY
jgi:hypothetical protein